MSERLVLVHNPNSTNAARVPHEVLKPLRKSGTDFTLFETQHNTTEENIDDMRGAFRPGDTIVVAGGDGTKMQAMNAVLRNGLQNEVQLGLLPYGNYNDLADNNLDIQAIAEKRYTTGAHTPMTVDVNGEYLFHSPSYLTIGALANIAANFSDEQVREKLKRKQGLGRKIGNFGVLGASYFKERTYKLPPFHTSESPVIQAATSDVLFLNSKRAGGIIRSHPDYGVEDYFGYHEANINNIPGSLPFGLSALSGHALADRFNSLRLEFERPSTVPVQSEGEFRNLHRTADIFVFKDPADTLRILHAA